MAQKLKTFEVVRTPKLRDATGAYCKRGETCQLTKELAEHYHKLGYIRVQMGRLFDDESDRTDGSADEASDDNGPDDAESVAASGTSDEGSSSEDAKADAGASEAKASGGRLANRRRKRVAG